MSSTIVLKKNVDISKVGVSTQRASMSLENFKKWCDLHGYTGDIEKAYRDLNPNAKVPTSKK